jgi:hypothetical protein
VIGISINILKSFVVCEGKFFLKRLKEKNMGRMSLTVFFKKKEIRRWINPRCSFP